MKNNFQFESILKNANGDNKAFPKLGNVHREAFAEVPPRVEYSLTDLGQTLRPVLDAMRAWGENYKEQHAPTGISKRITSIPKSPHVS